MANNTKKKHSAARKLIPAAGMLAVSAAMLASSTYAWFTMNRVVEVQNMQVKAKGEGGLLVSEVNAAGATGWDALAIYESSDPRTTVSLYPASTKDSKTWWHANSTTLSQGAELTADNAKSEYLSSDNYSDISNIATASTSSAVANTSALGTVHYIDANADGAYNNGEGYYMQYTYYLKASSDENITLGNAVGTRNVMINVPAVSAGTGSADLDKSLRVGVKLDGYFYIFAPVTGADTEYYVTTVAAGTTNVAATVYAAETDVATHLTSLNNMTLTGTQVDVYVWFEGEDTNCKSTNLTATLDALDIQVKFKLVDVTGSAATMGGVAIPT